jgi:hypothetical protein
MNQKLGGTIFETNVIDNDILISNLNQNLFLELYEESLDKLQEAFEAFKNSIDFKIL